MSSLKNSEKEIEEEPVNNNSTTTNTLPEETTKSAVVNAVTDGLQTVGGEEEDVIQHQEEEEEEKNGVNSNNNKKSNVFAVPAAVDVGSEVDGVKSSGKDGKITDGNESGEIGQIQVDNDNDNDSKGEKNREIRENKNKNKNENENDDESVKKSGGGGKGWSFSGFFNKVKTKVSEAVEAIPVVLANDSSSSGKTKMEEEGKNESNDDKQKTSSLNNSISNSISAIKGSAFYSSFISRSKSVIKNVQKGYKSSADYFKKNFDMFFNEETNFLNENFENVDFSKASSIEDFFVLFKGEEKEKYLENLARECLEEIGQVESKKQILELLSMMTKDDDDEINRVNDIVLERLKNDGKLNIEIYKTILSISSTSIEQFNSIYLTFKTQIENSSDPDEVIVFGQKIQNQIFTLTNYYLCLVLTIVLTYICWFSKELCCEKQKIFIPKQFKVLKEGELKKEEEKDHNLVLIRTLNFLFFFSKNQLCEIKKQSIQGISKINYLTTTKVIKNEKEEEEKKNEINNFTLDLEKKILEIQNFSLKKIELIITNLLVIMKYSLIKL